MAVSQGTIKDVEFESKELNETLTLLVYTPANFTPLYKYSLLIVQEWKRLFSNGKARTLCR